MQTFTNPHNPGSPTNFIPSTEPEPVSQPEADKPSMDPSEMQIVPAANSNSEPSSGETAFDLPDGWFVEVRPRGPDSPSTAPHADKYYYEPGTGRRFRSLLSVKRHLMGDQEVLTCKKRIKVRDPQNMQICPAKSSYTSVGLPEGWIVEICPRSPNSVVTADKYYYEPGTGRKFRSLVSVKRYLAGEEEPPRRERSHNTDKSLVLYQNSGTFRRIVYGGKVLRPDEVEEARHMKLEDIFPETNQFQHSDTLPDGWIVEEVPRKDGFRSDRYFIDPVSGRRFRSTLEVHRFLEQQRKTPKCKALALSNRSTVSSKALTLSSRSTAARSPHPRKKNTSIQTFNDRICDLRNPPKKINWVYSGDGKDDWSPLVEECMVPNYMKEEWSETFLIGMNSKNRHLPQLTMNESNLG